MFRGYSVGGRTGQLNPPSLLVRFPPGQRPPVPRGGIEVLHILRVVVDLVGARRPGRHRKLRRGAQQPPGANRHVHQMRVGLRSGFLNRFGPVTLPA